jgi:DtxR family Mn-dependent transcriptional regulator
MGTSAFERYLDVIYEIEAEMGEVRVKDIARALGISYPSVSEMVDRLVSEGLVTHDKYRHISLTAKGRRIGKGLDEKHEVLKRFFTNVLGVDEEVADTDACEIEHVISDESLVRLVRYLESLPEPKGRRHRR